MSTSLRVVPPEQPLDFDPDEFEGVVFVRRSDSPAWAAMQPPGVEDELTEEDRALLAEAKAERAAREAIEVEDELTLAEEINDHRRPTWADAFREAGYGD